MKHGHALAIGLLALALTACGGSHHHNDDSTSVAVTGPGLTSDYRIEAVLSDKSLDPSYIYQDPLDLQVLDSVQFQLVNYPSGTASSRTVVSTVGTTTGSATSFTSSDTLNTAGVLTPGGNFTASATDSGSTQYIVSAAYQGATYSAYYKTNPRLSSARVRGQVVDASGTGVYNAEVDFYGPRNSTSARDVILQTVRTGPDGTFRASVPLPSDLAADAAASYTLTVRQPTGYGTSFTYEGNSYTTGGTTRPEILLPAGDTYLDSTLQLGGTDATTFAKR